MSPSVRLSYNRYWNHFTQDIQRLDLDFWPYSNHEALIPSIEQVLSAFPIASLHDDAQNFQAWSSKDELSDEKIANSNLGRE